MGVPIWGWMVNQKANSFCSFCFMFLYLWLLFLNNFGCQLVTGCSWSLALCLFVTQYPISLELPYELLESILSLWGYKRKCDSNKIDLQWIVLLSNDLYFVFNVWFNVALDMQIFLLSHFLWEFVKKLMFVPLFLVALRTWRNPL